MTDLSDLIQRGMPTKGADYVPHIHREGARFHVPYWSAYLDDRGEVRAERHCSHPRCILNKEADERLLSLQEPKP